MTVEYADPEKHFALEFSLAVVRHEDYDALTTALNDLRRKYGLGGSSLGISSPRRNSVVNR